MAPLTVVPDTDVVAKVENITCNFNDFYLVAKINHCRKHACVSPVGLKVCPTSPTSHLFCHKCVQHLCQSNCLRGQNWHFESSFDFPSANNGYE